ncbi:putative transporter svop-1 [Bolinopsis microptera]|uniref:putative transporter svop-1 n=1 Tax=Bolinopsis microptera TaxID=2820187 RepID=UPI003078C273
METSDENTQLKEDFQNKEDDSTKEPDSKLDINEALETAGFGCGTFLFSLGPFLLFCLEGGEIMILSIVGIMVRCEWELTTFWVTALQITVFIGMALASLLFSGAGDKFGRKPVALAGAIGVTIAGLLCGLATKYWHLAVLRGLVGVFIGVSIGPGLALTAEISTIKIRGFLVSYGSLAWGIGASLTSALAYFVVDPYGWRGLMIGTAIMFSPSILFLAIAGESPRFDAKKGNWDRAERTLLTVAKLNCTAGNMTVRLKRGQKSDDNSGLGCCSSLTYIKSNGLLKNLIVITTFGAAATFIYYAISYSMPRFLNEGYCSDEIVPVELSCHFDKSVLFDLGIISLFEPLGVLVATVMIETRLGRKITFQSSVLLLLIATASLYVCVNKTYAFVFFTISKFAAAQIVFGLYLLGAEYFPTEVRSFVIAVGLGFWRVGASAGIACSQFIFNLHPRIVLAFTQIAAVVVSICLCVLGKETAGTHIE